MTEPQPPIQIQLPPIFQEMASQWPTVLQRLGAIEAKPIPDASSTVAIVAVLAFLLGALAVLGGGAYLLWGP